MSVKDQIVTLKKAISITAEHSQRLTLMDALRSAYLLDKDQPNAELVSRDFIEQATIYIHEDTLSIEEKQSFMKMLFDAYVTLAPNDFHSFLIALEWDREMKDRFYQPRMSILRSIVDDMTDLMVNDKYDMLMLSMPPGTGKSTLGLFFLTWVIGREPEKCNLAIGYASGMAKSFFTRICSIHADEVEYNYHKIFPRLSEIYRSAKEMEIDFSNDPNDVKKGFVSLTCASIDGQLTGRTRCEGVLYCDDLVEGAETAMSMQRLDTLWTKYTDNGRSRKKDGCKELHIGTRWSLHDPIGRLMTEYGQDKRCKVISMPALDDNDESLFDYEYGVGFSTEMFRDIRRLQNTLSWNALYMQRPMESEGLLFPVDALHRYRIADIDFLHNPPDDVFAFCDVAFGGADYLSMPIMAQYGTDPPFVIDTVFIKGAYTVTQPVVVGKIAQWGVQRVVFESNNGGDFYAEDIKRLLKEQQIACYVTTVRAGTRISKEARIIQHSPAILSFRYRAADDYPEDGQYRNFMQNLVTYTAEGNNEHDDAPDSCAGAAAMMRTNTRAKIKILTRKFL